MIKNANVQVNILIPFQVWLGGSFDTPRHFHSKRTVLEPFNRLQSRPSESVFPVRFDLHSFFQVDSLHPLISDEAGKVAAVAMAGRVVAAVPPVHDSPREPIPKPKSILFFSSTSLFSRVAQG